MADMDVDTPNEKNKKNKRTLDSVKKEYLLGDRSSLERTAKRALSDADEPRAKRTKTPPVPSIALKKWKQTLAGKNVVYSEPLSRKLLTRLCQSGLLRKTVKVDRLNGNFGSCPIDVSEETHLKKMLAELLVSDSGYSILY